MDIQCPYCGNVGSVDAELTDGQPLRCPFCDQKFFFKASPQSAGQPDDSLPSHGSRPLSIAGILMKWAVAIFIVICIANAVAKIRGCLSDSGRREAKYEETEKREEGFSQEDAIKMAYILGALSGANNANNANSSGRSDAVRSWSPPVQPIRYDNNYERFANQGRMSESRNASAPVSKRSYRQSYPFEVWECCYCHRQVSSPSRPRNGEYTCLHSPRVGGGFGSCYFERVDARR